MKKFDAFDDSAEDDGDIDEGEKFPTAVYTVYNVHGEPVGHRLYSYQPVYEPSIDSDSGEIGEFEEPDSDDDDTHFTVLKGGLFQDHNDNEENINKLKHQYFERYLDKRRKRFLTKNLDEGKTDFSSELEGEESSIVATKSTVVIKRPKRDVYVEEGDRDNWTLKPTLYHSELNNDINEELLRVIPLETNTYFNGSYTHEMVVIPLQYNNTNSTEVDNIMEKREKRTSRKTDRLNQTTATIPKT